MNDVLNYAEEVIVMSEGKVLYHTKPSELFEKYSGSLESLGLVLPKSIDFLNRLNKNLKNPLKFENEIKEEDILKVIEERLVNKG